MVPSAQFHMQVLVERVLHKFSYPPNLQGAAAQGVLMQEVKLCADGATA
jgi:hypothetical protein